VEADGTLTLCDYKTDRLRTEDFTASLPAQARESALRERLLADHGDQLRIYADAVADMLGRRPDRTVIYSLPLGKEVELQALL
jgi:ATP-dependent exoDNAse (exonuclease V) beta subunit